MQTTIYVLQTPIYTHACTLHFTKDVLTQRYVFTQSQRVYIRNVPQLLLMQ